MGMVHAQAVDELLPIGEFAERCGLSPKVLRTYASAGLLTPAAVDGASGYRYYSQRQLHEARTIALLRRADVPLKDIASFLSNPSTARLDQWEQELDAETRSRMQALQEALQHMTSTALADTGPTGHASPLGERNMIHLSAEAASDIGKVRASNQDVLLVNDGLFGVADGMGGHAAGEVAAGLAVEVVRARFNFNRTADGLLEACREANRAIWRRAEDDAELTGMGTTLTAVGLVSGGGATELAVVHVGDSRVYLVQQGETRRVTEDHTLTGERVRAGELTEAQAREDPHRHILTRALGVGPEVEPDLVHVTAGSGDRLLVCTDGLFNELEEHEISSVLTSVHEPKEAAAELVRFANSRGGHDNVSVVIVDVEQTPAETS
jgi:PPM family protein phosphatase